MIIESEPATAPTLASSSGNTINDGSDRRRQRDGPSSVRHSLSHVSSSFSATTSTKPPLPYSVLPSYGGGSPQRRQRRCSALAATTPARRQGTDDGIVANTTGSCSVPHRSASFLPEPLSMVAQQPDGDGGAMIRWWGDEDAWLHGR